MRRLLAVALLAATAACGGGMQAAPTAAPSSEAPSDLKAAPDFALQTFGGGTFKLSDHNGKLPVVLNFWAPW